MTNTPLNWDVLLIGGHSTSGKSTVARSLGRRCGIPVLAHTPLILEGDGILPQLALQPICDGVDVTGRVQSLFIIEPDEERFSQTCRARWQHDPDAADALRWRRLAWAYGQWLQQESERLQLPVIQSQPWETLTDRIESILNP